MKVPLCLLVLMSLLSLSEASIRYYSKGCIDLSADILINAEYKDALGATKTTVYNVPTDAIITVSCKDRALSKKYAKLDIVFGKDRLTLEFQAPALVGKTISLIGSSYSYTQDPVRFKGVLKETTHVAKTTFDEDEFPIGVWKKKYICSDRTILAGNVSIELTNMILSVFRTDDDAIDVDKCPEETLTNAKSVSDNSGLLRINDTCMNGSFELVIMGKYGDNKGKSRNFEYFVPSSSNLTSACEYVILQKKKALLRIAFQSDVFELGFTAPAVYGDTISLKSVNFTIVLDKRKFPDISVSKTESIVRDFSSGDYKIGEWGKVTTCSSILLNMGGGLKVELRKISWSIFKAQKASKMVECAAPLFVPRLKRELVWTNYF